MDVKFQSNRFLRCPKISSSRKNFGIDIEKTVFVPEAFYRKASILRKVFGIEQDLNDDLNSDLKVLKSRKYPEIRKKNSVRQIYLTLNEDSLNLPALNHEIYTSQKSIRIEKNKKVNKNMIKKPKISLKKTSLPVLTKRRSSIESFLKNETISGW